MPLCSKLFTDIAILLLRILERLGTKKKKVLSHLLKPDIWKWMRFVLALMGQIVDEIFKMKNIERMFHELISELKTFLNNEIRKENLVNFEH